MNNAGILAALVMGEYDTITITTPYDMRVAAKILDDMKG